MKLKLYICFSVLLALFQLGSSAFAQTVWLDSFSPSDLPLSESEQVALTAELARSLQRGSPRLPDLPAAARRDSARRFIVFTLGDLKSYPAVMMVSGDGLTEAFTRGVRELDLKRNSFGSEKYLRIDIITQVRELNLLGFDRPLLLEPGRDGLAFDSEQRVVLLPDELIARKVISDDRKIGKQALTNLLATRGIKTEEIELLEEGSEVKKLIAFKTNSSFSDGVSAYPIYRGHKLHSETTVDQLLKAASAAGDYLERSLRADGSFDYDYDAATDSLTDDYNILRHAGTVFSLIDLYSTTRDQKRLPAIKSALKWLLSQCKPCGPQNEQLCVVEDDFVKLGGNALAVLALARYTRITKDQSFKTELTKLASWIASNLRTDGSFLVHKQRYSTGEIDGFISGYYPGEAIFALTEIFRVDRNSEWIDVAEKAAKFIIQVRDADVPDAKLNHDHWLLYALNNLYRIRQNRLYLDHTKRLVRVITTSQIMSASEVDWIGGYYRPPRSTPTATRSEGLVAAYLLLQEFSGREMITEAENAIEKGVLFQLQLQITPDSGMFLPNFQRAKGGIRGSLSDFEVRIDYAQHSLSSFLLYHRILVELAEKEAGRR